MTLKGKIWTIGFLSVLMMVCATLSFSQQGQGARPKAGATKLQAKPRIGVMVRPYNDSIVIRWSPADIEVWKKGKVKGYHVYRTLLREGKPVSEPVRITDEPVLPISYEIFENQYANHPVGAKAIFTVGALKEGHTDKDVREAIERSKGEAFVHVMAIIASNNYPLVGRLSGMYYVDKNVQAGRKYEYEVRLAPEAGLQASAKAVATVGEPYILPPIEGLTGRSRRTIANLEWREHPAKVEFAYYNIYRSTKEDGEYKKLNELPFTSFRTDIMPKDRVGYRDTIPSIGVPYYYKVQGVTTFGDESPFSEVVTVYSGQSLFTNPELAELTVIENKSVELSWILDDAKSQKNLVGFVVQRTRDPLSYQYEQVNKLPVKKYSIRDEKPLKYGYYRVAAIGIAGDTTYSSHRAISLIDTVAPLAPEVAVAMADTAKRVTIKWKPSKADDLNGYRIFRANSLNEEFQRLTIGVQQDTLFYDTISAKLGYRSVFYKIYALDHHENSAPILKPIEIIFPDNTPPYDPEVMQLESGVDSIYLRWLPSRSNDVVKCHLLRKGKYEGEWQTLLTWEKDSLKTFRSYIDTSVSAGTEYFYWVQAIDGVGLKSSQKGIVSATPLKQMVAPEIKGFRAIPAPANNFIKLSWDYSQRGVSQFAVYRKAENGKLTLMYTLPASAREYYDKQVQPSTEYTYFIQALFSDFAKSPYTGPLVVKY